MNNTVFDSHQAQEAMSGPRPVVKRSYPKFRWWDVDKHKFFYSSNALFGEVGDEVKSEFIAPHVIITEKHDRKLTPEDMKYLSEFTGVLDSTPEMRPIFSGDIVKIPDAQGNGKDEQFVVEWAVPFARWNISPYLIGRRQIFIVGNIYENEPQKKTVGFDVGGVDISRINLKETQRIIN